MSSSDIPPSALPDLRVNMERMAAIQKQYMEQAQQLWGTLSGQMTAAMPPMPGVEVPAAPPATPLPPLKDRRFADASWTQSPASEMAARLYLLNAQSLQAMADAFEGDKKTVARLKFAVQQWIDAASPANYLATNPEAMAKAIATQGESLQKGMEQLLADLQKGRVSQTDTTVFELGRNVATTQGAVVFENALFQLLEYTPLTAQVHERPMLFVPPCINKYYILDLQPENSLIRYTVEQGHRVFVLSWRNPDDSLASRTWDDYIEHAVVRAIQAVQDISGQERINTLGFCVGGTLLATALAVLAEHGQHPAHSMTLLTTMLDFEDTGVLDVFVDEAAVRSREMAIGPEAPGGPGLLKGQELASTFNFLRPNDLVWNYVVSNYLKGEPPPAFDLLYWNGDATHLPGPMYCWYLRNTYLENRLAQPGAATVCGVPVDLGKIQTQTYLYASREDHIVPWNSAWASTRLLRGPVRFVLGASGHIAGVINPASKNRRNFWNDGSEPVASDKPVTARSRTRSTGRTAAPDTAQAWLDAATQHPGSWWNDWRQWLAGAGGKLVAAPKKPGAKGYPVIEPAPGRYVRQPAS
ncbi:class I poly(R)-hydroxyalkanoic acid synthase [Amphibiibacter pelophylacis]|uniref:Class I poly(R)-hydroxyalkanoic acid synthase n=1 Tax=Amphibiibacter pelophylacis TaxID=1799477 RepID=A0ACC6P300_9BURK